MQDSPPEIAGNLDDSGLSAMVEATSRARYRRIVAVSEESETMPSRSMSRSKACSSRTSAHMAQGVPGLDVIYPVSTGATSRPRTRLKSRQKLLSTAGSMPNSQRHRIFLKSVASPATRPFIVCRSRINGVDGFHAVWRSAVVDDQVAGSAPSSRRM